jgi:hypothetical protein
MRATFDAATGIATAGGYVWRRPSAPPIRRAHASRIIPAGYSDFAAAVGESPFAPGDSSRCVSSGELGTTAMNIADAEERV